MLAVQQAGNFMEQFFGMLRNVVRIGQPRWRDIEKAVKIDTHCGIEGTAQQLDGRGAAQSLMDGI